MSNYESYRALCDQAHYHNTLYFERNAPEIDDENFDRLLKGIRDLEQAHPEWVYPGSPTQSVGEKTTKGFRQIPHRSSMLSFDKVFTREELEAFDRRLQKDLGSSITYSVEAKLDGCAISAWYRNGHFERGLTRGNGELGDDVTQNLATIATLPQKLHAKQPPEFLELRGEVFITKAQFARINQERLIKGQTPFANARNLTSGTLKMLDAKAVAQRGLSLVFYAVAEDTSRAISTYAEGRQAMKLWGLPVLAQAHSVCGLDSVFNAIEDYRSQRAQLDFEIDGAVIKVDHLFAGQDLGSTGQYYRWGIAFKFTAERALTKILQIVLQVGRTGLVTPVAQLDPVLLAGSRVARATLHNGEEIRRKDIRVGDFAYIEKGGDIIPKVVEVALERRSFDVHPWVPPERCPSCDAHLVREQIHLRCPNTRCKEQVLGRLRHFVSRGGMDIDGLGGKVLELLIEKRGIRSPAQLYTLEVETLRDLPGFGERSASALCRAIDESRQRPLAQFILALGISHIGKGAAEALAWRFGTLQALCTCNEATLLDVGGIGEKGALSLLEFLRNSDNIKLLQQLKVAGVEPKAPSIDGAFAQHPFQRKKFVLTGSLDQYSRHQVVALIEERGGIVASSLSKKVDFLIVGENPGSKLEKAKLWSVALLSEEQFAKLL